MTKRKHGIRFIPIQILLCLLILLTGTVSLGARTIPRLQPRERIFSIKAQARNFTALGFAEASLYLSGAADEHYGRYEERIEGLFSRFEEQYTPAGTEERLYDLGEEILQFLHDEVFKVYREEQTRVDAALDSGVYNCVSSAVLYTVFALNYELPVKVVNTSDHAFCAVATERGVIDVETTTRYGFQPGQKKEFTDSFGRTGFSYVPPGKYSERFEADLIDLLGFILRNRISSLQRQKRYGDTVPLAVDRYALLETDEVFHELVNEFVNYAASKNRLGLFADALKFLDTVSVQYGPLERFDELYETLLYNLVLKLSEAGGYDEAEQEITLRRENRSISGEVYSDLKLIIDEKRTYEQVITQPFDEALEYVTGAYRAGSIPGERYREFVVYLHGRESERFAEQGEWIAAAETAESGAELIGGNRKLEQAEESYRYNYSITVHNRFADLFNRRRYREAEVILEEALTEVPDSMILIKDLKQLEKISDIGG